MVWNSSQKEKEQQRDELHPFEEMLVDRHAAHGRQVLQAEGPHRGAHRQRREQHHTTQHVDGVNEDEKASPSRLMMARVVDDS